MFCFMFHITVPIIHYSWSYNRSWDPVKPALAPPPPPPQYFFNTDVPRRYVCCGSLLLLVLAVRIYTLVQLLC